MKHRLRDRNLKIVDKKEILEDDPYKLSIHTSTNFNKSDSGSKRLNISRMLENSRKKISMRKASELFQSGVRPKSSKVSKRNEVIEFDNIKWISIISAYDPTRLKNVSVSKKSCQKFLQTQGSNIKTDARSNLYFTDLIKNFKSWLNKIQIQYCYIMNTFLFAKKSVNITLVEIRPKIDEVINQTKHMQQNLQDCLKSYQNHEFRQLLRKYHIHLQNSKEIENIIMVVNKSKNRIVDLYKKFDDDRKIQDKLNRVKNDGIHQVKKIICEHNQIQLQNKIMDRIQQAINEMAQKSGQAYRKIRGIKHLMEKFKNTQSQSGNSMKNVDINAIHLMVKVCREICYQSQAFESFSVRFLHEGDIINDDLKTIIKTYEQQMVDERKKAIELMMKFLNIIFSETIRKLRDNSKIAIVYQNSQSHHEQYRKMLRMLQDIADCLLDQNKKISLQKLIKQTRIVFDRLYDELRYLKQNKRFEEIDTQEGLISTLEVSKLIKQYKDKILLVRKKFQAIHREINLAPIKIDSIPQDKQTQFINNVISLSKKINNSDLKNQIQHVKCFSPVQNIGLIKISQQVDEEKILQEITSISNEFLQLQQKNILQKYFGPLKLQNLIFKESIVMLNLKHLSSKTKQKNLIPQLTELLKIRNQWVEKHKKTSPQMKTYFERILAHTLTKGLKNQDIKQIENYKNTSFPTNQDQIQPLRSKAKYRQVLLDLIQGSVLRTTKYLKSEGGTDKNIQADQDLNDRYHHNLVGPTRSKHNFYVSSKLQRSVININNFIAAFVKISELKKNFNSQSYLAKEYLIQFSESLFMMTYLKHSSKGNQDQAKQQIFQLVQKLDAICGNKVLCLTRRILQEENNWREVDKNTISQKSIELDKLPIHVQKVVQVLEFFKGKTLQMSDTCRTALQSFDQHLKNVQNSKDEILQFSKLSLYAKILVAVVKYCKETQQVVHIVLDNFKHPIALLNPKQNVLKQIFPGIKKGKQLTLSQIQKIGFNLPKIGIQLKIKKSKSSEIKQAFTNKARKESKNQYYLQMDEEIVEQSGSVAEEMIDQMPVDVEEIDEYELDMPDDQMGEQLDEDVHQDLEEDMIQDFQAPLDQVDDDIEKEKIQEQNLQELLDGSDNIGKSKAKNKKDKSKQHIDDDLQQYDWQEDEQKLKRKNKEVEMQLKNKQLKAKKQEQESKRKVDQARKKQEEQKKVSEQKQKEKRMKKELVVFSQIQPPKKTLSHSVYEVLTFITSLHQMKNLINYLCQFEENYIKNNIQWSKIQQYFNDHNLSHQTPSTKELQQQSKIQIDKYIKNIEQEVDNKLKKDFHFDLNVYNQLKSLDPVKKLKKDLILLKNGNWQALEKILFANHVIYNVLKHKNSVLYIFIKDPLFQYDQFGSIDGYLSKNFKYYQRSQFDIQGYAQKCFSLHTIGTKQDSYQIVSYVAKNQRNLITNIEQTQATYEKLKQTLSNFANGAKDHINKFDLCLELYKKALQIKEKVDLDLNWYSDNIKFLQQSGTDQNNVLSYFTFVKNNIKIVIKKIKSLESKLYNLSFKCDKDNIFQCIEEIFQLYGEQIESSITLNKGQINLRAFVFDKSNYLDNLKKIKKILSISQDDREFQTEKLVLLLLIGSSGQIHKEIQQSKILQNSHKINTRNYELLLEIVTLFRVSHNFILIKGKSVQFFAIKKQKDECISAFLTKITSIILQDKSISNLLMTNSYFSSLQSLQNPLSLSTYQKVFVEVRLKQLFKENVKENSLCKQVEIIINEDIFELNKKIWNEESQKIIKQVVECVNNEKKSIGKLVSNISKLKPCKLIYERHLSSQTPSNLLSLWQEYSKSFKKILQSTQSLLGRNHWLLSLVSISTQLNDLVLKSTKQNIQAISSIISPSNPDHSLQSIESQITEVFSWIKSIMTQQRKQKFLIITRSGQGKKSMVYFDLNIEKFNFEYFSENFSWIEPNKPQTKQFLYSLMFDNLSPSNRLQQIKKLFDLQKNDTVYNIETQKLETFLTTKLSSFSSIQHYQQRSNKIRQFVQVFNRIFFISKTTKNLNFKQESETLVKLQNQIKSQIRELQVIYDFKSLVSRYGSMLWKGNGVLESVKKILINEFVKNENIPEDQIKDVLLKLDKIKVNKSTSSVDSYDPFFAWVYHTVMSLLKLPFFSIITHTVINSQTKKSEAQFLAVIVTEKSSNPNENNQELQKYLKEMFQFTQHKPIYLKQNDLTVELKRQPVFVQMELKIKDTELKAIVEFLNEHLCEEKGEDCVQSKEMCLRVDEIREKINKKGQLQEERIFIRLIPLKNFLKSSIQQFNINITQQKLTVSLQFIFLFAPPSTSTQSDLQKYLPLNGSAVDMFDDVYMGKHLKLNKLKQWLYGFYKNYFDSKNKAMEIKEFYDEFIKYHMSKVLPENKEVIDLIFNKISYESVVNEEMKINDRSVLFLFSSLLLKDQCVKNLNDFKQKQYQSKPQLLNFYDSDIQELAKKLQSQVHSQLEILEGQIRINMERKIKKLAAQKLKEIEKSYLANKETQLQLIFKEIVNVGQDMNIIQQQPRNNETEQRNQTISTPNLHDQNSNESPIETKQNPKQKLSSLLMKLRDKNFDSYIQIRLMFEFEHFSNDSQKEMEREILEHFSQIISKCKILSPKKFSQRLIKRVDETYEGKSARQQILFLYLLLKNNDVKYAELFVSKNSTML